MKSDELKKEIDFATQNLESDYSCGLFQNPSILVTKEIKQFARDNPNSRAAIGIASHDDYWIDQGDRDFVRGKHNAKNRSTLVTQILVAREIYRPEAADFEIYRKRDTKDFGFNLALSLNPHIAITVSRLMEELVR